MRVWIAGLAVLVAACSSEPTGSTATDERPALIAQRQAMLDKASATGFDIEKLKCPARTVSDETVETTLLLFVNERPDLVDQSRLRASSDDAITAFETCGANMDQIVNEMQRSDEALFQGLSVAMLQAGRGLE